MLFENRNRHEFFQKRSKRANGLSNLLPGFAAESDFAIPETIIQVYGDNFDGGGFSGHIGGLISKTGALSRINRSYGGLTRGIMQCNETTEFFTLNRTSPPTPYNLTPKNYVVFMIAYVSNETIGTGYYLTGCDFRKNDNSEMRLALPIAFTGGENQFGYRYGVGEVVDVFNIIPAYNVYDPALIRCLILEENAGKLYLNGNLAVQGGWTPTELGGLGYLNRMIGTSSNFKFANIAHLSIHQFAPDKKVLKAWVNLYAQSLVTYYNNVPVWNNI